MKARAVQSVAIALRPSLTSMLLPETNVEEKASRKESGVSTALPGAVIRTVPGAAKACASQPAMVNLGPMLKLMMMLRRRNSRHTRAHWQGPTLPLGCVMVVRYASR
jgi:hypothetical protein